MTESQHQGTHHVVHQTPLGIMHLAASADQLTGAWFVGQLHGAREEDLGLRVEVADSPVLAQAVQELEEYFAGQRTEFTVAVRPEGTDFQLAVWEALNEVPFGFTTTYGAISKQVGPHAPAQAVGQAVARNRLMIFVPCHRVIAADGKMTGYSAGVEKKRFLLDFERPGEQESTLF